MIERSITVEAGTAVLIDGDAAQIVEFDGRKVVVTYADGRYSSFSLTEFVTRARGLEPVQPGEDPGLALAGLTAEQRQQVAERGEHVREVLTGYKSGYAQAAREGEPRAEYAPEKPLMARYTAKAAELSVTSRAVEKWVAAYRDSGEAGLVDRRRGRSGFSVVDPRWDAAVRAELADSVSASTPTRSAVLVRVAERLDREHGPGAVPIPSQATAYRRLAQLAKGTNAVSGSAQARRSIAARPQGVFGRLRATRPGEYVILDTQDLDVFAMEPVTCRWVRAQLTVAQDLFDRQILGLKVTPVSTKAVDVAGVLFEAVTGRSSGRPTLGPAHGLPQLWCSPRTAPQQNRRRCGAHRRRSSSTTARRSCRRTCSESAPGWASRSSPPSHANRPINSWHHTALLVVDVVVVSLARTGLRAGRPMRGRARSGPGSW
jgi:hypothetical protein